MEPSTQSNAVLTRNDVVAVAVRLFSLYLVVIVLQGLAHVAFAPTDWEFAGVVAVSVTYGVLLLLAAGLWFFPLTIARKLLPAARDSGSVAVTRAPDLQALAFSVLGLWFLASGLIDALNLSFFFVHLEHYSPVYEMPPEQKGQIAATCGRLLIGALLLSGSLGFSRMLHRFRYGGIVPDDRAGRGAVQQDETSDAR